MLFGKLFQSSETTDQTQKVASSQDEVLYSLNDIKTMIVERVIQLYQAGQLIDEELKTYCAAVAADIPIKPLDQRKATLAPTLPSPQTAQASTVAHVTESVDPKKETEKTQTNSLATNVAIKNTESTDSQAPSTQTPPVIASASRISHHPSGETTLPITSPSPPTLVVQQDNADRPPPAKVKSAANPASVTSQQTRTDIISPRTEEYEYQPEFPRHRSHENQAESTRSPITEQTQQFVDEVPKASVISDLHSNIQPAVTAHKPTSPKNTFTPTTATTENQIGLIGIQQQEIAGRESVVSASSSPQFYSPELPSNYVKRNPERIQQAFLEQQNVTPPTHLSPSWQIDTPVPETPFAKEADFQALQQRLQDLETPAERAHRVLMKEKKAQSPQVGGLQFQESSISPILPQRQTANFAASMTNTGRAVQLSAPQPPSFQISVRGLEEERQISPNVQNKPPLSTMPNQTPPESQAATVVSAPFSALNTAEPITLSPTHNLSVDNTHQTETPANFHSPSISFSSKEPGIIPQTTELSNNYMQDQSSHSSFHHPATPLLREQKEAPVVTNQQVPQRSEPPNYGQHSIVNKTSSAPFQSVLADVQPELDFE